MAFRKIDRDKARKRLVEARQHDVAARQHVAAADNQVAVTEMQLAEAVALEQARLDNSKVRHGGLPLAVSPDGGARRLPTQLCATWRLCACRAGAKRGGQADGRCGWRGPARQAPEGFGSPTSRIYGPHARGDCGCALCLAAIVIALACSAGYLLLHCVAGDMRL